MCWHWWNYTIARRGACHSLIPGHYRTLLELMVDRCNLQFGCINTASEVQLTTRNMPCRFVSSWNRFRHLLCVCNAPWLAECLIFLWTVLEGRDRIWWSDMRSFKESIRYSRAAHELIRKFYWWGKAPSQGIVQTPLVLVYFKCLPLKHDKRMWNNGKFVWF